MKTIWIITHETKTFKKSKLYCQSESNPFWNRNPKKAMIFDTYQKAYAVLRRIEKAGFSGQVLKIEK